jgi:CheY-like chemotaxis protein
MVYGFIQQSNGAIWVETAPGKGTTFTVLLPSVRLANSRIERSEFIQDTRLPEDDFTSDADRPIVLLVEDDQDVRRTIRRKLAGIGYPLVEAANATEALNLLGRIDEIGILLSDIDMPGGVDGYGLAARVRSEFPTKGIVLMSGQQQYDAAKDQNTPFLRKPFSATDLSEALALVTPIVPQNSKLLK